jgi:HlyD family secretion protein
LFKKYEFNKQCSTLIAAYREALNKLQRTIRSNRSRMAQAETRFMTAKRRYEMELTQREGLEHQLKACVIKAAQPGLVAYGDLNAGSNYNYNYPIEEGATVRLRQTMLTIPDMSQMGVKVNVHESQIKKVRIGQPVKVRVDAEPGKELDGRVAELAILPDSSSSRYTPNLKVYPCIIHINGYHPWMKPGMNAKVEIIVDQLADVHLCARAVRRGGAGSSLLLHQQQRQSWSAVRSAPDCSTTSSSKCAMVLREARRWRWPCRRSPRWI